MYGIGLGAFSLTVKSSSHNTSKTCLDSCGFCESDYDFRGAQVDWNFLFRQLKLIFVSMKNAVDTSVSCFHVCIEFEAISPRVSAHADGSGSVWLKNNYYFQHFPWLFSTACMRKYRLSPSVVNCHTQYMASSSSSIQAQHAYPVTRSAHRCEEETTEKVGRGRQSVNM